jgi:hypothetical protein
MATFNGLFKDLSCSDNQSELSLSPDSNESEISEEEEENEEDLWYNQSSDSEEEDDELTKPLLTLLAITTIVFTMPKTTRKEYSTSARIKAIYMLEEKKSAGKILEVTRVSRTRAYALAAVTKERGWRENEDMPLEVAHVLNQPRSRRLAVSPNAIKYVLKVVL